MKDLGNPNVRWIFGTSLMLSNMALSSEDLGSWDSGVAAS